MKGSEWASLMTYDSMLGGFGRREKEQGLKEAKKSKEDLILFQAQSGLWEETQPLLSWRQ